MTNGQGRGWSASFRSRITIAACGNSPQPEDAVLAAHPRHRQLAFGLLQKFSCSSIAHLRLSS